MAPPADHQLSQKAFGYAASDTSGSLAPFHFTRRENGDDDVTIKVYFCGVCHSDLHVLKNEWGNTNYPVVPGHEIAGLVTKVGSNVEKFKVGDRVGVGVIVDSCRTCEFCEQKSESYCPQFVPTYNAITKDGTTHGGYSDMIVVDQRYVLRFPDNLPLDAGAPLLCAGITVYSPMKYYGMTEPGKHLGVAGVGGLGHVAVKIGKAFGLKVTAILKTSSRKEVEAVEKLGVDSYLAISDPVEMKAAMNSMDYIIDAIPCVHPLAPLLGLLKINGKLVMVGIPDKPLELPVFPLIAGRRLIGGTHFGSIIETQEMLDFCGKHNVTAEVEVIKMDYINTAMERLAKSDVKYRFVIDVANSLVEHS